VNHTFTTPLALTASLQPFAGLRDSIWCEYPTEATPMAANLTLEKITPDGNGQIVLTDRPGLGVTVNRETLRQYLQPLEIVVGGKLLYRNPEVE